MCDGVSEEDGITGEDFKVIEFLINVQFNFLIQLLSVSADVL